MDRLSPLISFTCFYTILGVSNHFLTKAPSTLPLKKQRDYQGQHISLIHSVLSIIICLYVYLKEGGIDYLASTNQWHLLVIGVIFTQHSLGYFFYDMVYAEVFSLHDWAMKTHHICVLLGGTVMYMAETGGSPATSNCKIVCILITEGSNPCMMLRKIMKAKELQKTGIYRIIELTFVVSFIFLRSVLCTFINYNMWLTQLSFVTKVSISVTYAVGFFWIFTILSIAIKEMPDRHWTTRVLAYALQIVNRFKRYCVAITFIWALVLPNVLTQHLGFSFINLKIRSFTVF